MGSMAGSQKSKTSIPAWIQDASKEALAMARHQGQMGYVPYQGPDVAAINPNQISAMNNINNAANSFGLAAPERAMAGMPKAKSFAGGVDGYSGYGIYKGAMRDWKQRAPGQYEAWMDQFINPKTGAPAKFNPTPKTEGGGSGKKTTLPKGPPDRGEYIDRIWAPPF